MIVLWDGGDLYKGYYDPQTGWLDLVSSRTAEGGQAHSVGETFLLSVDEEGTFCHLGLDVTAGEAEPLLERPLEAPDALDAEVELLEDRQPTWFFDRSRGTLEVSFGDFGSAQWGRIGDNLLWLALDEEGCLRGFCFEGVSRDPGGKAQAAWLEDVGL